MSVRAATALVILLALAPLPAQDGGKKQEEPDWLGDTSQKPLVAGKTRQTGTVWVRDAKKTGDATLRKLSLEAGSDTALSCWSADAKFLFILEKRGLLHKIAVPSFKEERDLYIAKPCASMVLSREGLLIARESGELLVIDPGSLEISKQFPIDSTLLLSAPSLSVAFVGGRSEEELCVVDLRAGKITGAVEAAKLRRNAGSRLRRHPQSAPLRSFAKPAITQDGRFLFCLDSSSLHRFSITGSSLRYEEAGAPVGHTTHFYALSPDSRYVAVAPAEANFVPADQNFSHGQRTMIYKTSHLQMPVLSTPEWCLTFDPAAGRTYGANGDSVVIVANALGVREKYYDFHESGGTRQILAHPDGWNLFVMTTKWMYWLEIPRAEGRK